MISQNKSYSEDQRVADRCCFFHYQYGYNLLLPVDDELKSGQRFLIDISCTENQKGKDHKNVIVTYLTQPKYFQISLGLVYRNIFVFKERMGTVKIGMK